jgi:uncharacterized protein (DUF427 family)
MRAVWNGQVVAESDDTVVVEGNHYFPADSVRPEYLGASDTHSRCLWKGIARYYDLKVGDRVNRDAAWYYPDPSPAAAEIKDRIAFWRGVKVEKGGEPARLVDIPEGESCDPTPGDQRGGVLAGLVRRLTGA